WCQMKMKGHLTVWVILLLGGFLLGFVPEYLKNRALQAELQNPQKTIDALKLQVQLGDIRDLASLTLLELSRQNYGLARDYLGQYYNKLKEAVDTVQDAGLKKALEELANTQESLISASAGANQNSLTAMQPIVAKTFQVTRIAR